MNVAKMTGTEKKSAWDKSWYRMYEIDTAIMHCETGGGADMLESLLIERRSLNLKMRAMHRDGWSRLRVERKLENNGEEWAGFFG